MHLKRYLSPACIWVLGFLLAFELLLRASPYVQFWCTTFHSPGVLGPYLFNREQLLRHGERVQILLFGDSMSMWGVDACQLDRDLGLKGGVFNFSHGSAGPESHLLNFLALRPSLPHLKSVILFVNFDRLRESRAAKQTVAEDLLQTNDRPASLLGRYSLAFKLSPFLRFRLSRRYFDMRPRALGGTYMAENAPKDPYIPPTKPFVPDPAALANLRELLLTLKNQGLAVRALLVPCHPVFEAQNQEGDLFLRRLFGDYQAAGLVEFQPDAFSGLSRELTPHFFDYGHLVASGAALFTRALALHLQEHPLPPLSPPASPRKAAFAVP